MWGKFYVNGCCRYLQRHWCGLGDSPHAEQLAKFINILTKGLAKKKVVNFFFLKWNKIKFIISKMCHLVWEKLFLKISTRWNITTSQLWCSCENVSKYVSHFIVFFFLYQWIKFDYLYNTSAQKFTTEKKKYLKIFNIYMIVKLDAQTDLNSYDNAL